MSNNNTEYDALRDGMNFAFSCLFFFPLFIISAYVPPLIPVCGLIGFLMVMVAVAE
jgi:hypothetical protein